MSQTFSLVCDETKTKCWVGQGHQCEMTILYSEQPNTMVALAEFLKFNMDRPLRFVCDELEENRLDDDDDLWEGYREFTEEIAVPLVQ